MYSGLRGDNLSPDAFTVPKLIISSLFALVNLSLQTYYLPASLLFFKTDKHIGSFQN